MKPNLTTGKDLLGSWMEDVERGEAPLRFSLPGPFETIDIRPGRLLLFGGQPGAGKTAFLMQVVIDLLRLNQTARVVVANVEMTPQLLLERAVSRLSRVALSSIADRQMTPEELARVRAAVATLTPIGPRLAFLAAPYTLEHLAAGADAFGPNVVVLDYIQRFAPGAGDHSGREALETAATVLRRFCDLGAAVLCVSAVARQKSHAGSTYGGLNLASFRGSSELEYGADAAYLLVPGKDGHGITFECAKNRHGPVVDVLAAFEPVIQTFTAAPAGLDGFDAATPAKTHKAKGS